MLVAAALIATMYRYWLLAPVLQHVSILRWRLLAFVVAAACGGVLALLRLPVIAMVCESMIGLLMGGTWAAFQGQTDVRMTIVDAFLSHLEPLWPTVILLTVTASISGFCGSRWAGRRAACGPTP